MSVGVLIITHVRVGKDLVATVTDMMDELPLRTDLLEVRRIQDTDAMLRQGKRLLERLDSGDGVLILTDAYGSTPSNIANGIAEGTNCRVVSGLNLPMLVSVYNYPAFSLHELAICAWRNGRDGIVICNQEDD